MDLDTATLSELMTELQQVVTTISSIENTLTGGVSLQYAEEAKVLLRDLNSYKGRLESAISKRST